MESIGIGATFRRASSALWLQRRVYGLLGLGWLAVEFAFLGCRRYFELHLRSEAIDWISPMVSGVSEWNWHYLLHLASEVPHNLFGAVFVVLIMRTLLVATPTGRGWLHSDFARSVLSIFLFKFSISTFYLICYWLTFPWAFGVPYSLWRIPIWVIGVGITSRLCFIYATASKGQGWQLRRSWQDAAGNGLRLFMLFAIVSFPALAVGSVLESLLFSSADNADATPEILASALLVALRRVVASMLLLALIATAFARLTGFPAAGIPGSRRSSKQLVEVFE